MINTNMTKKRISIDTLEHLKLASKRWFLLSVHKWIGGSLTNYRNIYKSLYALLRISKKMCTIKKLNYKEAVKGMLVNRVPKLPAVFISLGENHFGLNEARSIGIKTVLFLEDSHEDFLLGDITISSNMNNLSAVLYTQLLKEALYIGKIKNGVYFPNVPENTKQLLQKVSKKNRLKSYIKSNRVRIKSKKK